MKTVDLSHLGIEAKNIARNPATSRLYMDAIRYEPSTSLSAFGALIAYSGEKTGRSPSDKRITKNAASKDDVWWGDINMPIGEHTFEINRERAKDYLNTRQQIYVIDDVNLLAGVEVVLGSLAVDLEGVLTDGHVDVAPPDVIFGGGIFGDPLVAGRATSFFTGVGNECTESRKASGWLVADCVHVEP